MTLLIYTAIPPIALPSGATSSATPEEHLASFVEAAAHCEIEKGGESLGFVWEEHHCNEKADTDFHKSLREIP